MPQTNRDYKIFDNEIFRESLIPTAIQPKIWSSQNLVLNILDKIPPTKQRYIRGNQSPFMNKDILKALMNGARFRNRFLKESTPMNRLAYKKQRNYCVSVMRENQNNITLLWMLINLND